MTDKYNKIITCLLGQLVGKILTTNFIHSVEQNILDQGMLKSFIVEWWDHLLEEYELFDFEILSDTFYTILLRREEEGRPILCQAQFDPVKLTSEVVNIKQYSVVYKYLLEDSVLGAQILPDPEEIEKDKLNELIEESFSDPDFNSNVSLKESQSFSLPSSVYWVCPKPLFDDALKENMGADRVRDFLGLTGIRGEENVLAVVLSEGYVQQLSPIRPTPLDAGFYDGFKCLSDQGRDTGHGHDSGYTLDFKEHAKGSSNADGGQEFVINEYKTKKVESFRLVNLGQTTTEIIADEKMLKRMKKLGKEQSKSLENQLMALIES